VFCAAVAFFKEAAAVFFARQPDQTPAQTHKMQRMSQKVYRKNKTYP
jgi:hypothetical protein